ncbi:AAA family ATPase [Mycobacterium malmoense]|uniref:AAA family ATPase n=2 Tax=Mycobacterium malmoense TaxID=1780 RepID=UPI001C7CABD5|nr:AAA family ATPase [Mycobacterium malmoense]QZA16201.1 AAA family ATPase [Mycobacterium malmoense]UNB93010.1 AAA family ATPase [Mycobacterium malmoense]
MNTANTLADLAPTERWCPPGFGENEAAREALGGRDACAGAALTAERQEVLDWAQARIDELIGLTEAKEHFRVWRTALESDGGAMISCAENHMVFLGAPGTAKKTFARIISEVLFGLGTLTRPHVTEVTAHDLIVEGDLLRSAAKMKDICGQARGGVLFLDEAHRLAPNTDNGPWGIEAIYALLTCMAAYRDDLVVILAGHPRPMQDFLTTHAGLAARFPTTITFASYTPDEIIALGRRIAGREQLVVHDTAWELLRVEAARLRSIPYDSATLRDVAGNARYAREVIEACQRVRARRLHRRAPHRRDLGQLLCTDPSVLHVNTTDMERAITASRPATALAAYRHLYPNTETHQHNTFPQTQPNHR